MLKILMAGKNIIATKVSSVVNKQPPGLRYGLETSVKMGYKHRFAPHALEML